MAFDLDSFEEAKKASVAQLLFKCARIINELGIEKLRKEAKQPKLRAAHMALFPHIDFEGTRATVLAEKLGISKQAIGQLVNELVAMGSLEKFPDPSDGRAKLIRFSTQGQLGLSRGLEILGNIEADLKERIGKKHMKRLHEALLALEKALLEKPRSDLDAQET